MPMRPTVAERALLVNLALLLARPAVAHPEFSPTEVNRYARFDLISTSELRLAYTIMVGSGPALALRAEADANHDGRLDDSETGALGARLAARVRAALTLQVDGAAVVPRFDEPVVGLAGPEVAPSPFSVDLVARIPCPGAPPHVVRLDDRADEDGELEVRIEEAPGTRLVGAHQGSGDDARQNRFFFRGRRRSVLEDRSVSFRFADAPAPPRAARARAHSWPAPLTVALLITAAAAVALVRGRVKAQRSKNG
jgi:hypothetical protein